MRIAIVNRHPDDVLGGSESQCHNIASQLTKDGHDIIYIAPDGGEHHKTDYLVLSVEAKSKSIARCVLQNRPDIVYWRLNKYHFRNAAKEIRNNGIPILFGISHLSDTKKFHSLANPRGGIRSALRAFKQALLNAYNYGGYKFVDGATSVNPDFLGLLPVPFDHFVPNSVITQAISFCWARPFVVWVSNIKRQKRPEMFVELAKRLDQMGVDFLMIGNIQFSEYDWLNDTAATPENFYFLGPKSLEEVNGVLSKAICLVHTCEPEGFGNNFIQAWRAKCPTVTLGFDPGGYIERNQLGGYAYDNFPRFVEQVRVLIDDKELRESCAERSLIFAKENFSIERTTSEFMNAIKRVLSNG